MVGGRCAATYLGRPWRYSGDVGITREERRANAKVNAASFVPRLARYHHFAAGEPERTAAPAAAAAAAPQRILGSVGSAPSRMPDWASFIRFADEAG